MTEQEAIIIHAVLDAMLVNLGRPKYLPDILSRNGFDNKYLSSILTRLKSDGLVTQPNNSELYIILPTAKALDVAQYEGGFRGHQANLAAQQQREAQLRQEKDELEKAAALATVSAAKASASATRAAWVAAIASIISIALSLFAIAH